MNIPTIKRPWQKSHRQGNKTSDPFYQSKQWKGVKSLFMSSLPTTQLPPINGMAYQNKYCFDCWEEGRINDERIEIDHVVAIKDGGDRTDKNNLRSRCHAHHNRKTHIERKKRLKSEGKIKPGV